MGDKYTIEGLNARINKYLEGGQLVFGPELFNDILPISKTYTTAKLAKDLTDITQKNESLEYNGSLHERTISRYGESE